jgi:hypothetical protein
MPWLSAGSVSSDVQDSVLYSDGVTDLHLLIPKDPPLNERHPKAKDVSFDMCQYGVGQGIDTGISELTSLTLSDSAQGAATTAP